jgi:hypothetical protein
VGTEEELQALLEAHDENNPSHGENDPSGSLGGNEKEPAEITITNVLCIICEKSGSSEGMFITCSNHSRSVWEIHG